MPEGLETQFAVQCDESQTFRHKGWAEQRQAVWNSLHRIDASRSRRNAFEGCGSCCRVFRLSGYEAGEGSVEGREFKVLSDKCHDRFCEPCVRMRAAGVRELILPMMGREEQRFLTLTLRSHVGEKLSAMLDRLYEAFADLRRTAWWRRSITGGVACCEIKLGSRSGRWHPHLHCIVEGGWFDISDLRRLWRLATGDSFEVHVRRVGPGVKDGLYVAKYASKPITSSFWRDEAKLDEAIEALKGRRLVRTFGSWYDRRIEKWAGDGIPEIGDWDEDRVRGWVAIGTISHVWFGANNGDPICEAAWEAIKGGFRDTS